jgi:hypothetical protein
MIDPGLKAHQTPCVWASGSLDINHGINFMLCYKKDKRIARKDRIISKRQQNIMKNL